ncbi:MAG: flagellar biosynthetic protein FliO [Aquabacterium sp.]
MGLSILWFLAILALIPISLWVLKRSGMAPGAAGTTAAFFKPVAQFNLGPGQRLMAVEVGAGDAKQWLVLGVTAQHISTLHTMAPQELPAAQMPSVHPAFATLLHRFSAPQDKT